MPPQPLKVSVLYVSGTPDPAIPQVFSGLDNVKLLRETRDPGSLMAQYRNESPDLVLLFMNGLDGIPEWLDPLLSRLPRSEVVFCSDSSDPGLLIQIIKMRPGGFMPLPLNPKELQGHFKRVKAERQISSPLGLGRTLAVVSAKAGLGATTVATNLAIALAELHPGEILLMDLARPFPHVGHFLDLKSQCNIKDLADNTGGWDPLFMQKVIQKHKSGLDILLGSPSYDPESRGFPELPALEKIFQTLRASYQWIIIDLGGWLDPLYFHVLQKSDEILLLVQLSIPDLQNLKSFEALFRDLDIDDAKVKVVVNHYAKNYSLLGLKDVESICRRPVYFTLPHDYISLMGSINQGVPLRESAPRCKLCRSLKELAKLLADEQAPKIKKLPAAKPGAVHYGLLHRLFHLSGGMSHGNHDQ
jgi:pilus assembly protein CpaE